MSTWDLYDGHDHQLGHTLLLDGRRVLAQMVDATVSEQRVLATASELLAVCERINALRRNPPEAGGIGDLLGGLGDWLEDTIAQARGEEAP